MNDKINSEKKDSFAPVDSVGDYDESKPAVNNSPSRPCVMVGGKRYVLAEDEKVTLVPDHLTDSEKLLKISSPPRPVSPLLSLYMILLNGPAPLFGWIFIVMGLLFPTLILGTRENESSFFSKEMGGMLVSLIFPLVGYFLVAGNIRQGRKIARLLKLGKAGKGVPVAVENSGMRINNQPVKNVIYHFLDHEQKEHEVSASALNIDPLTDEESELILFDPVNPDNAIVFDSLPGKITILSQKGFYLNSWRLLALIFPLLFVMIAVMEVVLILTFLFTGWRFVDFIDLVL